jgi:hypothetical protein
MHGQQNVKIREEKLRGKGIRDRGKVKQKEKENWKETRKWKRKL